MKTQGNDTMFINFELVDLLFITLYSNKELEVLDILEPEMLSTLGAVGRTGKCKLVEFTFIFPFFGNIFFDGRVPLTSACVCIKFGV